MSPPLTLRGRLLPAVLVLIVGALAVGAVTWLVSSGDGCSPAASASTKTPDPKNRLTAEENDSASADDLQPECTRSGLLPSVVSAAGVLLVGLLALMLTVRKPIAPVAGGTPSSLMNESPPHVDHLLVEGDDRRALVDALIYALDRMQGTAVEARLQAALARVGVTPVGVVGEIFDPTRHEAVASVAATGEQQDGTVADVEARGYVDGDVLIRPAQVSVFQSGR